MVLTLVALAFPAMVGCSGERGLEDPLLEGLAPSDALAAHLAEGLHGLSEPDRGDPEVLRDLRRFDDLQRGIYDPSRCAAAVDSLFEFWTEDPAHVMWPELAKRNTHFPGVQDRLDAMLARPAFADTTTVVFAYLQGWSQLFADDAASRFEDIGDRFPGLPPFDGLWIDLKAAFASRMHGRPDESLRIALDALPRARELGGHRLEAWVWVEIARADLALDELDDALYAAVMAETLIRAVVPGQRAHTGLMGALELKANILAGRRNKPAALALYEDNIATAAAFDLVYLGAKNSNRASMFAEMMGDRGLGQRYSRDSLRFALAARDSLDTPRFLMNLARRFRMSGELDSCLVYQTRAVRWVAAYHDAENVARMPLMQAEYYSQVGDYAVVDSLLQAAASMSRNEGTAEARAELHLELIRGWMEADRPDMVYRSIDAIGDLSGNVGDSYADRHVTADLNLLIGEFLTHRGDYVRAAEALSAAAAALERRPTPARSWTLARNKGILARKRGDLVSAEREFGRCIELGVELQSPAKESTGRFLLGSVLLAGGRFGEARRAFPSTDAEDFVGRFTTRVSALLLTGMSHSLEGDHDLALEILDSARQSCQSWSPPNLTARIDLETGRALAAAGRAAEAARLYRDVAGRLETSERDDSAPELAYFNGDLRRDLVEAAILSGEFEPDDALRFARRVLPRWRSTRSGPDEPPAPPQIIFFVGDRISGRWLIDADRVRWNELPGAGPLGELLAPVLADMAAPGREVGAGPAVRLSEALLAGLAEAWPSGGTLAVVPDLILFGVPWAALPLPGGKGALVDHGPLVFHDQPSSESGGGRIHRGDGRLLVAGADGQRSAGLRPLHHAEQEARDVAAAWPQDRTVLRLGDEASSALTANAELSDFEVIHVSSHALVYDGHSERTTLQLGGEGGEALTASTISALDIDADLVFLSCCEAGDGGGSRSAYAGLARSFLDAGARSVVAPLITIDDEAARAMAARFYAHWLSGKTVPGALSSAQRDMRDGDGRWSHPFYWAFYQPIVGESAIATP